MIIHQIHMQQHSECLIRNISSTTAQKGIFRIIYIINRHAGSREGASSASQTRTQKPTASRLGGPLAPSSPSPIKHAGHNRPTSFDSRPDATARYDEIETPTGLPDKVPRHRPRLHDGGGGALALRGENCCQGMDRWSCATVPARVMEITLEG